MEASLFGERYDCDARTANEKRLKSERREFFEYSELRLSAAGKCYLLRATHASIKHWLCIPRFRSPERIIGVRKLATPKRKPAKNAKKQPPPTARSATSVDKYVGLRVRAARLAQDMSQEALADALGITFQQVQKYEKGVNRVAISRLVQVAEVLGKPVTWFTPASNLDEADTEAAEQMAKGDTRTLLATFARIEDPEIRKRVVALVKAIAAGEG